MSYLPYDSTMVLLHAGWIRGQHFRGQRLATQAWTAQGQDSHGPRLDNCPAEYNSAYFFTSIVSTRVSQSSKLSCNADKEVLLDSVTVRSQI